MKMNMADYQSLLPPELHLTLQQPLNGHNCFGPVFDASISHEGGPSQSPVKRVVRFLRPLPDLPGWTRSLLERFYRLDCVRLPYVSTPRNFGIANDWAYLVSDRHDKTLDSLLKENTNGLSKEEAWNIAEQLIEGLGALHAIGIAHGDLRPKRIFVDQLPKGFQPMVSIGDPLLGEVTRASDGCLVDDDVRNYRMPGQNNSGQSNSGQSNSGQSNSGQSNSPVEPSFKADLDALGCIVCELVMGPGGNPNRQPVIVGQATDQKPLALAIGGHHDLAILAELLFGKARANLTNAVDLRRELAARATQVRRREKNRAFVTACVGTLVLLIACLVAWLSFVAMSKANTRIEELQEQIKERNEQISSFQDESERLKQDVDELKRQTDELKERLSKSDRDNRDLHDENADIKRQLHEAVHGLSQEEAVARKEWGQALQARKERKAPKPTLEELNEFEELCVMWKKRESDPTQDVDPAKVSPLLDGWYREIQDLKDNTYVWLDHDAKMTRTFVAARVSPWDGAKVQAARVRWQGLEAAAGAWNAYVASSTLTWAQVHAAARSQNAVPNSEAREALKDWLFGMAKKTFTLKIDPMAMRGDYLVWLYTGADEKAWPQGATAVSIPFEWHPDDVVKLLLEGPRGIGSGWARPNLIGPTPFDGPLAPYRMHLAGQVVSTDGSIVLPLRILNCPGPPRNWKPPLPNPPPISNSGGPQR